MGLCRKVKAKSNEQTASYAEKTKTDHKTIEPSDIVSAKPVFVQETDVFGSIYDGETLNKLYLTHPEMYKAVSEVVPERTIIGLQRLLITTLLMLGVSEHGTITGMKKEGSGSLDPSSIDDMLDTGKRVGIALNKSLLESLEEEQRQGKKKGRTGFLRLLKILIYMTSSLN